MVPLNSHLNALHFLFSYSFSHFCSKVGEEKLPIPLRFVVWKVTLGYLVVVLEPARLCCSERCLYFSLKCFPLYHTTPLHSLLTAEVLFPCIKQVYLDWNLHLCVLIVLRESLSFPPFIVKVIMLIAKKISMCFIVQVIG